MSAAGRSSSRTSSTSSSEVWPPTKRSAPSRNPPGPNRPTPIRWACRARLTGTFISGGSFDAITVTGGIFESIDYVTGKQVVITAVAVPEPGALALFGLGLAMLVAVRGRP